MTRLEEVLKLKKSVLDSYGVTVTFDDTGLPRSCFANLDNTKYVGTITCWPESLFEFQFNNCESGNVVLLETIDINDDAELALYIEEIYRTKLT